MLDRLRSTYWVLSLGVIAAFAFFAVLGGLTPTNSAAAFVVVGVLCVLWLAHAYLGHRHVHDALRDPALAHARERRGF